MRRCLKWLVCGSLFLWVLWGCGYKKDENAIDRYKQSDRDGARMEETESDSGNNHIKREETLPEENASAWGRAYAGYLELAGGSPDGSHRTGFSFSLIYVDDDDIPELVCDTGVEAGGCLILTYHNGEMDALQTRRLNFDYIERGGLLCNSDGNMGYYYDMVYKIQDGKWVLAGEGQYGDPEGGPVEDENGDLIFEYFWEGEKMSQEDYEAELSKVYDRKQARMPDTYYDFQEVLSILRTGKHSSADHTYELIVKDLTWREAQKECQERGGYLAVITSKEEWEAVEDQIRKEDKTGVTFYLGSNNGRVDGEPVFGYQWIEPDGSRREMPFRVYYPFWAFYGGYNMEPSYRGTTEDGREVDEEYVVMIYRKAEDRYFLNDVPNDILDAAPSYAGNVGYICEYE